MRHVVFCLDKEHYALPLASIREVVPPPASLSQVPRAPAAVRGIMNLRGRVVTVVAMRGLLGRGTEQAKDARAGVVPDQKILLLDRGRRDLGLLVTEVEGIDWVEKIAAPPGPPSPAIRGVARLKGRAVTVLDPQGLDEEVVSMFQAQPALPLRSLGTSK